ncbi:MAG: hypothetical protein QM730_08530 [Anaerolineales bacterium]
MKRFHVKNFRLPVALLFFLITVFFAWTFAEAPFSEFVNSLILNGGTTLSALIAAVIFTFIPAFFTREEPPRMIWTSFAVCLWLWVVAEAIWGYLYIRDGEVPVFSIADIFWLAGYIALTVSLARQFRLVLFAQKETIAWVALSVWLALLIVITVILLVIRSETPLADFFSYFYLLADALIGLLALYLVYAFRGRALAIPWLTISSFVISDFIYIRLTESGVYDYVMSGISIALLADTLYLIAYLLVAWGGLEQYLLLRSNADHFHDSNWPR